MKTLLMLPGISGKNEENFFSSRQAAEILVDGLPSLQNSEVSSKYLKPCFKFYRVFKNDTAVTAVSTNDFKPFKPVLLK